MGDGDMGAIESSEQRDRETQRHIQNVSHRRGQRWRKTKQKKKKWPLANGQRSQFVHALHPRLARLTRSFLCLRIFVGFGTNGTYSTYIGSAIHVSRGVLFFFVVSEVNHDRAPGFGGHFDRNASLTSFSRRSITVHVFLSILSLVVLLSDDACVVGGD